MLAAKAISNWHILKWPCSKVLMKLCSKPALRLLKIKDFFRELRKLFTFFSFSSYFFSVKACLITKITVWYFNLGIILIHKIGSNCEKPVDRNIDFLLFMSIKVFLGFKFHFFFPLQYSRKHYLLMLELNYFSYFSSFSVEYECEDKNRYPDFQCSWKHEYLQENGS